MNFRHYLPKKPDLTFYVDDSMPRSSDMPTICETFVPSSGQKVRCSCGSYDVFTQNGKFVINDAFLLVNDSRLLKACAVTP